MGDLKYRKLEDTLKADILSGRYSGATKFPSIAALMRRSGLSKNTVLHALDELKNQGLISRAQGRISVVTKIGSNRAIGLLLPGVVPWSDYFQPIIDKIASLSRQEGFDLLVAHCQSTTLKGRLRDVREHVSELISRKVAGVIYQPVEFFPEGVGENERHLADLSRAEIPVVLIDGDIVPPPARSPYDLVTIDNVGAGEALANHLFEAGAQVVHFVMRPECYSTILLRRRGVMCAAIAHGREWTERNVLVASPTDRAAVRRHLRQTPRPDAFVCQNDATAVALAQTLADLKVRVPDDVMLAGFSDIRQARQMTPPLTTVRQPGLEIAEMAFRRLIDRIVHPELPPVCISLQAPLIVRGSTVRATKKLYG